MANSKNNKPNKRNFLWHSSIHVVAFVISTLSINAATYTFNGSVDGNWNNATNWTVSGSTYTWPNAQFNNEYINEDALLIFIGNSNVVTRSGQLSVDGPRDGSATNVLVISNATLNVQNSGWIGDWNGTKAHIKVIDGGKLSYSGNLRDGDDNGSIGFVTVSNGTLSTTGDLELGHRSGATGTLNMYSGSISAGGTFKLAGNGSATATVNQHGGTISVANLSFAGNHTYNFYNGIFKVSSANLSIDDMKAHLTSGNIAATCKYAVGQRNGKTILVAKPQLPPPGNALDFDGSDDYVALSDGKVSAASLGLPTREITLEAWARVDSLANWRAFVCFQQDNGSTEHGWYLGYDNNGKYVFALAGGGVGLTWLKSPATYSTGVWRHVCGTYDGTTMRLYVDGTEVATSTNETGDISYMDSWLRLGEYKDDNESYLIDGALDEVRIWNTARTAAEISNDMTRVLDDDMPGLYADWRFDRSEGDVLIDYGPNTIFGALNNMDDSDWIVSGAGITTTPAAVSAPAATNISFSSADLQAELMATGDTAVVEQGFVWNTNSGFMPDDGTSISVTNGPYTPATFSMSVSNMPVNSDIFFRGFVRDGSGYSYTAEKAFKTLSDIPVVDSPSVISSGETNAVLGGRITDIGMSSVDERGIYWSTTNGFPVGSGTLVAESSGPYPTGTFSIAVSNLPLGTEIFFRAFASNSAGIGYSPLSFFYTVSELPLVGNPRAALVSNDVAIVGGTLISTGAAAFVERGIDWSTNSTFAEGDGTRVSLPGKSLPGDYFITLTDLPTQTPIYFRLYAINGNGTNYSAATSFTTGQAGNTRFVKPTVRFTGATTATLQWFTETPTDSILDYGRTSAFGTRLTDATQTTNHVFHLTNLQWRCKYYFRIGHTDGGTEVFYPTHYPGEPPFVNTDNFWFDNAINYTLPDVSDATSPWPADSLTPVFSNTAARILSETDIRDGYCLVLGSGSGRLAFELAKQSRLMVFGVDTNAVRLKQATSDLMKAGVYGSRVKLRTVNSYTNLPFSQYFARLIVSEEVITSGAPVGTMKEAYRVLRPSGGVLYIGQPSGITPALTEAALTNWFAACTNTFSNSVTNDAGVWGQAVRPAIPGSAWWTCMYGNPDNAANAHDKSLHLRSTSDTQLQWIGRPGSDWGIDRGVRFSAPVSCNGTVYHQGYHRLAAMDAYNGAIFWSLEIPDLRRINVPHDSANVCADSNRLFVALSDQCREYDDDTGKLLRIRRIKIPGYDWGVLFRSGDLLIGSTVKTDSTYANIWGHGSWYEGGAGDPVNGQICSDTLFAEDADSPTRRWLYKGGVIINTTVTIGGGRIYFVENRNPAITNSASRRINSSDLWQQNYIVALNLADGTKLWETPINEDGSIVMYGLYGAVSDRFIICAQSSNVHLATYNAADGSPVWTTSFTWYATHHGGRMQHPVIIDDGIYIVPKAFSVNDGTVLRSSGVPYGRCGTVSACGDALVMRQHSDMRMWNPDTGAITDWKWLRGNCWLNMTPSGGMILQPESSGGCACQGWINTSVGFAPKESGQ